MKSESVLTERPSLTRAAREVLNQLILIVAVVAILGVGWLGVRSFEWMFPHAASTILKAFDRHHPR